MINHARTLFLNEDDSNRPEYGDLGEEYIPRDYAPNKYGGEVEAVRQPAIGTLGDPLYQNYRLAQIMSILHSNDVTREFVLGLDNRITYDPFKSGFFSIKDADIVESFTDINMFLATVGKGKPNDISGKSFYSWTVRTSGTDTLTVTSDWSSDVTNYTIVLDGTLSQLIPLENGLNLRLTVPTGGWAAGVIWTVKSYNLPSVDIGSLLATYDAIGAGNSSELFLDAPKDFTNLWKNGVSAVDRLSGIFGAAIYRMDRVYNVKQ